MRAPSFFSRLWRRAAQGPLPPAGQGLNVRSTTTVDPADIPPPMGPAGHVRMIPAASSPPIEQHVYYSDQPFWNQRRLAPTIQELADRLAPYNATRAPGRQRSQAGMPTRPPPATTAPPFKATTGARPSRRARHSGRRTRRLPAGRASRFAWTTFALWCLFLIVVRMWRAARSIFRSVRSVVWRTRVKES